MDKAARIRWSLILVALAATVAAIVAPAEEVDDVVAPNTRPAAVTPIATSVAASMLQPFASEAEADPFAPRGWTAPLVEVSLPPTAAVAAATAAPEVPQAPPLPYKFIGRFSDGAGGYVYLADGEVAHAVRTGDVVASTYKVVSIQPRQMVFEHLPTGTKQDFSLPDPDQ